MLWAETDIGSHHALHCEQDDTGKDNEHKGQRNLHHDKSCAQPMLMAGCSCRSA
jgi:hypothetical protein